MKPKIDMWCLLVIGVAMLAFGCSKKEKADSTSAPPVQTAPAPVQTAPTPVNSPPPAVRPAPQAVPVAQPVAAPPQAVVEPAPPDLVPLTQAVQVFTFRNKRRPISVNELVSAGLIKSLPALPPGKKLVISPTTPEVIMVNINQ